MFGVREMVIVLPVAAIVWLTNPDGRATALGWAHRVASGLGACFAARRAHTAPPALLSYLVEDPERTSYDKANVMRSWLALYA